jgi:hypothetical protein
VTVVAAEWVLVGIVVVLGLGVIYVLGGIERELRQIRVLIHNELSRKYGEDD